MDSILFIINPIAGSGKAKKLIDTIINRMEVEEIPYSIEMSDGPKAAVDIACKNAEKYDVVVAVGGDGTINEVAKGLAMAGEGILGIIPAGTGNDLAKDLQIPLDVNKSLDILLRQNVEHIDVAKVNEGYFFNIASVGIDAEVIANHSKFKKKLKGNMVYFASVIYSLFHYKRKNMKIVVDGRVYEESMSLVAVGNGKYYGGGFKIMPYAVKDDGYFHICMVSKLSKFKIFLLFPTVLFGKHLCLTNYVRVEKGKNVEIISDEDLFVNFDGEILEKTSYIKFVMEDKKVKMIC